MRWLPVTPSPPVANDPAAGVTSFGTRSCADAHLCAKRRRLRVRKGSAAASRWWWRPRYRFAPRPPASRRPQAAPRLPAVASASTDQFPFEPFSDLKQRHAASGLHRPAPQLAVPGVGPAAASARAAACARGERPRGSSSPTSVMKSRRLMSAPSLRTRQVTGQTSTLEG